MNTDTLLIDVAEVARLLSCSIDTVYRLVRAGLLPKPVKLIRSSRWRRVDVEAYVERDPGRRREQANRHAAKPEVRAKASARPARKEWQKARNKRDADTLSDGFVRRIMAQHTSMKGSDLPQGLVDAYRELMKLKRAINEKRG